MSIVIKPLSAQLVKDLDVSGKQDPYCKIQIGEQSQQTSVHQQGGLHPVWGQDLVFDYTTQTQIKVSVYDKDLLVDDFIGTAIIDINQIKESKLQEQIVNIKDKKGEHSGAVMMLVKIVENGLQQKKEADNNKQ